MITINPNIKVINKNLWLVDFQFVRLDYIQELKFTNVNGSDIACLTQNGKIVLNKAYDALQTVIPFLDAVMSLESKELHSKQGFCNVIRILVPKIEKWSDDAIKKFIWSDSSITSNWTTYRNLCNWEQKRRKVQKEYRKSHPIMFLIK